MLPLNKPLISRNSKVDFRIVFNSLFADIDYKFTFSARQGLYIIYKYLREKKGNCKVAVSPLTCYEALFPILSNEHEIIFIDINENTFLMDEEKLPDNIDVVQAIHLGGFPQNIEYLTTYCTANNIILIEDCAQAFGAKVNGTPVGNFGDFAVFSFMKNLHAIGGGLLLGNVKKDFEKLPPISIMTSLYRKLKQTLESHCSIKNGIYYKLLVKLINIKPEDTSQVFNTNSLNNEILNSIGKQLSMMDELLSRRNHNANKLLSGINNNDFVPQMPNSNTQPIYTRLLFKTKKQTKDVVEYLRKKNIGANHLTQQTLTYYQEPVTHHKMFKFFANKSHIEKYRALHDYVVSLPISAALTQEEIDYEIDIINNLIL